MTFLSFIIIAVLCGDISTDNYLKEYQEDDNHTLASLEATGKLYFLIERNYCINKTSNKCIISI